MQMELSSQDSAEQHRDPSSKQNTIVKLGEKIISKKCVQVSHRIHPLSQSGVPVSWVARGTHTPQLLQAQLLVQMHPSWDLQEQSAPQEQPILYI